MLSLSLSYTYQLGGSRDNAFPPKYKDIEKQWFKSE